MNKLNGQNYIYNLTPEEYDGYTSICVVARYRDYVVDHIKMRIDIMRYFADNQWTELMLPTLLGSNATCHIIMIYESSTNNIVVNSSGSAATNNWALQWLVIYGIK